MPHPRSAWSKSSPLPSLDRAAALSPQIDGEWRRNGANGRGTARGKQAAPLRGRYKMPNYRLISADSHVNEPPDLWVTRVDQKYRERAPRLAVDLPGKEGAYFLYEGYAPHPIGIGFGAGKSPDELKTFLTQATYADARPGGWDPSERKKDNAVDGVEA